MHAAVIGKAGGRGSGEMNMNDAFVGVGHGFDM